VGSLTFRQRQARPRAGIVLCSWVLIAILGATASRAQSPPRLTATIQPQALSGALDAFAKQTGLQLLYVSEIARGKVSKGAPAGLELGVALTRLLEGTTLRFEFLNERSVRIFTAKPAPSAEPAASREQHQASELHATIEEVTVSAALRDELQSLVPISMAAWTAEAIDMSGAKYFGAIANLTPGVELDSYPDYSAGIATNIAIRGVNSRDGSTAAVYIDDTPIPTDPGSSFGREYPLLFDLKRIEVLRGPQGVLYGEGAEGGAVRFITEAPGVTTWSGFGRGEAAATKGSAPSYEIGAAGGGPLSNGAGGIRLGAWLRHDGGFVDRVDPTTGATTQANSNWIRSEAASAAFTITPSEALEITPSIRYQSMDVNDTSAFFLSLSDPAKGVLKNGSALAQYYSDHFTLIPLKVAVSLEALDLSSTTAYIRRDARALEYNASLDVATQAQYPGDPVSLEQTVLSEELRLASPDRKGRFRWIVGTSYVHARYQEDQEISTSASADGGALNGRQFVNRTRSQLGMYGEFDLRLWERLTGRIGLRVERESYESQQQVAPFPPLIGAQYFSIDGASTAVIPRFNLTYQRDENSIYYATAAKGSRMGGPNNTVGLACPVSTPLAYGPDFVWNFEIGTKESLYDARLQLDGSVYYMTWQEMQVPIPLTNCGFSFTVNAGSASSRGFDLGVKAAASQHLSFAVTAAYTDAHYDETVTLNNQVVVSRGDAIGALPLVVAPWNVATTVAYETTLADARVTFFAQDMFNSRNPGPFSSDNPKGVTYAPQRRPNPSTNLLNLRAVTAWRAWEFALFINNVLDSQPTLQIRNHIATSDLLYATTFRPRTIGLTGSIQF
jgi:iron complex outermembrane recepter protein